MAMGDKGIITAVIIDVILMTVFILIFEIFRRYRTYQKFFFPKYFSDRHPGERPPRVNQKTSLPAFLSMLSKMTDDQLLRIAGLDATIYILTLKFSMQLFFGLSCLVLPILFPITITAGGDPAIDKYSGNVDKLGITYVASKSNRLWAHCFVFWACIIYLAWLMNRFHDRVVMARVKFFRMQPAGGPSHSILVTDFPGTLVGTFVTRGTQVLPSKGLRVKLQAMAKDTVKQIKVFLFGGVDADEELSPERRSQIENSEITQLLLEDEKAEAEKAKAKAKADRQASIRQAPKTSSPYTGKEDSPKDEEAAAEEAEGDDELDMAAIGLPTDERTVDKLNRRLKKRMEDEFAYVYGSEIVRDVAPVFDLAEVIRLQALYDQIKTQLELQIDKNNTKMRVLGYLNEEARDRTISEFMGKEVVEASAYADGGAGSSADGAPPKTAKELAAEEKKRRKLKFLRERRKVCVPFLGAWGKKEFEGKGMRPEVDTLDFLVARLTAIKAELHEAQLRATKEVAPACFVTFRDRWAAAAASTALHRRTTLEWLAQPAPDAHDVIWGNLRMRGWERSIRIMIVRAIIVLIVMNFTYIIAFVQGLTSIDQLKAIGLGPVVSNPTASAFLAGFLPGLALKIVLALLPPVLRLLGRMRGLNALSAIDFFVVKNFYIFQVIVVFLFNIGAGAILNQRTKLFKQVGKLPSILATAVPQTGQFFFTLVLLGALPGHAKNYVRIVGLIIYSIIRKIAPTERSLRKAWDSQEIEYGSQFPSHTVQILLGLVFAVIFPLLLPACLAYFFLWWLEETYTVMYVKHTPLESRGRLWLTFCNQVMVGLLIAQITLVGLLGLKKVPGPAIVVGISFVFTILYWRWFLETYTPTMTLLPMHDAAYIDRLQGPYDKKDEYVPRCLGFDQAEFDALMNETARNSEEVNLCLELLDSGVERGHPLAEARMAKLKGGSDLESGTGNGNGKEHTPVQRVGSGRNAVAPEEAA